MRGVSNKHCLLFFFFFHCNTSETASFDTAHICKDSLHKCLEETRGVFMRQILNAAKDAH